VVGAAGAAGGAAPVAAVGVDAAALLQYAADEVKVGFYAGVPDSLLAPFCAQLARLNDGGEVDAAGHAMSSSGDVRKNGAVVRHVVAANEGAAVGLALGYHLATGKLPLVYMQNSGLGNAVNPLLSAAHPHVYGCPMLLLVGWRGAPGTKDEPQHAVQGRQTLALLEALEIPVFTLPADDAGARDALARAARAARRSGGPVALLAPPKTFAAVKPAVLPLGGVGGAAGGGVAAAAEAGAAAAAAAAEETPVGGGGGGGDIWGDDDGPAIEELTMEEGAAPPAEEANLEDLD
jgi:phosphonopyruvate decarboxylase